MPSRHYQDPLAIAIAMALLPTALLLLPLLQYHFHRRTMPERREAIPTDSLANSLANSLADSLVNSLADSLVNSLAGFSRRLILSPIL